MVCRFTLFFSTSELHYNETFFITFGFFCGTFILRMEITLQLRLVLFVIVKYFLSRRDYVIYLFDVVTFCSDDRITFYFRMFELRMEIQLQLRFVIRLCDVLFITSQLRYLFVQYSYVF